MEYVDVEGIRVYVQPNDLGFTKSLIRYGVYDRPETDYLKHNLREGMTFVDVGANVGYYTFLASKQVGETGRVYSFEPDQSNYRQLIRGIAHNGMTNIIPTNCAVSNRTGTTTLYPAPGGSGCGYTIYPRNGDGLVREVTVCRLDSLLEWADFVKIDVEGAEPLVIEGMTNLIRRSENLSMLVEYYAPNLVDAGYSPRDFLDSLIDLDFELYRFKRRTPQKVSIGDLLCEELPFNLLCTRSPI